MTSVRPVELPETDLLAGLRGMANALVLQTDLLGEIAVCQLGGSLTQTAYALLSDLVTIRRRQPPAPHGAGAWSKPVMTWSPMTVDRHRRARRAPAARRTRVSSSSMFFVVERVPFA